MRGQRVATSVLCRLSHFEECFYSVTSLQEILRLSITYLAYTTSELDSNGRVQNKIFAIQPSIQLINAKSLNKKSIDTKKAWTLNEYETRGVNGPDRVGFEAILYPNPKFKSPKNSLKTQWAKKQLNPNPTHGFLSGFGSGNVEYQWETTYDRVIINSGKRVILNF